MTKTNKAHPSNFWFGFAVGTSIMAAGAYLLGTKKGRETLQQILEYAEKVEFGSDEFVHIISSLRKNDNTENTQTSSEHKNNLNTHTTLDGIMGKVREFADKSKSDKREFIK